MTTDLPTCPPRVQRRKWKPKSARVGPAGKGLEHLTAEQREKELATWRKGKANE